MIYNILTGNKTFLNQKCYAINDNKILLQDGVYNLLTKKIIEFPTDLKNCINTYERDKISLEKNGIWCIKNHEEGQKYMKEIYYYDFNSGILLSIIANITYPSFANEKIVFSNQNGTFLGVIKKGNLTQICKNYSARVKLENIKLYEFNITSIEMNTNCSINNRSICFCDIYISDNTGKFTHKDNISFNLINLDKDTDIKIQEKYLNVFQKIKERIDEKKQAWRASELRDEIIKERKNLIKKQPQQMIFIFSIIVITSVLVFVFPILYERRKQRKEMIKKAINILDTTWKEISPKKEPLNKALKSKKPYIILHKKAVDLFNKGKYEECIKLAKKSQEVKEKEQIAKKVLEKIHDIYLKTKNKYIQSIFKEAKNLFENGKYKLIDELYEKAFEKQQKIKGLVKYKGKWLKPKKVKELKEIEIGLDKNFADLTGYQFEEFVAKLFQKMGYKTTITSKSRDYGIDVVAKDKEDIIAIQCKKLKDGSNVGNRDIQRARGSMDFYNANKCVIVTNQDFTIQAKEQARRTKNIELWNKRILHQMVRRYFIES